MREACYLLIVVVLIGCSAQPEKGSPTGIGRVSVAPTRSTYEFECDVPPGHFSYWSRAIEANELVVSGTLQLRELRNDPRWQPLANVTAILRDKREWVALRVTRTSADAPTLTVEIQTSSDSQGDVIGSLPLTPGTVKFSLELTQPSMLNVSVGNVSGSRQLHDVHVTKTVLGCSTADFHFGDVVISEQ